MKESKKLKKARSNLLTLRDNAFFDKLKQALGIVSQDEKNSSSLIKLAEALVLAATDGVNQQEDLISSSVKQASASVGQTSATSNEEASIQKLASKLASDATLREGAALLYEWESKNTRD